MDDVIQEEISATTDWGIKLDPTGGKLWDGSVVLASLLAADFADDIREKRIIEIGCGTGALGIALGR